MSEKLKIISWLSTVFLTYIVAMLHARRIQGYLSGFDLAMPFFGLILAGPVGTVLLIIYRFKFFETKFFVKDDSK